VKGLAQLRSRVLRGQTRLERGPHAVRGELTLSGGIPVGLRLLGRHLAPGHPHAYALVRGTVEPDVQEALRRTVPEGGVVWDVGANIGFMSLVAARLVGRGGRVHAFEPAPASAAAVRDHARINGMEGLIDVVEAAAGSAPGRAPFLVVAEPSWSHLADRGRHGLTTASIDVEAVRLDDLVSAGRVDPPSVVKIDVEGSEGAVLRGIERTLALHRPAVVCELHETNDEVADLLEAAGYSLQNLDGPEPVRSAGPVHVLARPRR
jgi:FkbM family methyltransferase